jgi:hypothetical protein
VFDRGLRPCSPKGQLNQYDDLGQVGQGSQGGHAGPLAAYATANPTDTKPSAAIAVQAATRTASREMMFVSIE